MIITVTLAPSIDATYQATLVHGEVCRAAGLTIEPAGKGVNVSRALRAAGLPSLTILPAGGHCGALLQSLMDAEGIDCRIVPTAAETRLNTTVINEGVSTKINAPVRELSTSTADALLTTAVDAMASAASTRRRVARVEDKYREDWLALCGSMPGDTGIELMCALIRAARDHGIRCVIDTSGRALVAAAAAQPDLLAPNLEELAVLVSPGSHLPQAMDREGLGELIGRLAITLGTALLVSVGDQGALWTDDGTTVSATPGPVAARNTAGAGDALLAGWLSGPQEPVERLTRAVRWGTACCLSADTVPMDLEELLRQVDIPTAHCQQPTLRLSSDESPSPKP